MATVTEIGDGLELVRLGRSDWRITDRVVVASESARVLGFIERLSRARYELVWLTEPPRWAYVATLQSAVDAMMAGAESTGTSESTRRVEAENQTARRFRSGHLVRASMGVERATTNVRRHFKLKLDSLRLLRLPGSVVGQRPLAIELEPY